MLCVGGNIFCLPFLLVPVLHPVDEEGRPLQVLKVLLRMRRAGKQGLKIMKGLRLYLFASENFGNLGE